MTFPKEPGRIARSATISRFKKERHLRTLSEDDFRDSVVRPLLLSLGFRDGRDLCGPAEEGKDAAFLFDTPIGEPDLIVLQTKAGNLNLASDHSMNVETAVTQLRTAMQTRIAFLETKHRRLPVRALLCASGKINQRARDHICSELRDPRIQFLDADDLIPKIDQSFPALWLGIDADSFGYLRALRAHIEDSSELSLLSDLVSPGTASTVTNEAFAPLYVTRFMTKPKKLRGTLVSSPVVHEIPIESLSTDKSSRVLLIGEAGAGKSNSLRRIAYVLAERGMNSDKPPVVPVLLRARDISILASCSVLDAAHSATANFGGADVPAFGAAHLDSGRVLVLIDGLDEVASDAEKAKVLAAVSTFLEQYPKCRAVVSSRPIGPGIADDVLAKFTRFRISALKLSAAKRIIEHVRTGRALPAELGHDLLRRLEDLHGIELSPLIVTVFAATSDYDRQDIPANITELFKKFTELMLGRWDAKKGLAQQFHAPTKDYLLRLLALEMHRRRATEMSVRDLRDFLTRRLQEMDARVDAGELIDEAIHRSGLFVTTETSIAFRHLLLQEFFAGRGMSADEVQTHAGEDWWKRPIVFYFGEHPSEAPLLERLALSSPEELPEIRSQIASTLGLALQATYLVPVKTRVRILKWVLDTLAESGCELEATRVSKDERPIFRFVQYHFDTKDSLSCRLLPQLIETSLNESPGSANAEASRDLRRFWLVAGLIDIGELDRALEVLRGFTPGDRRLQLSLDVASFLASRNTSVSVAQRKVAEAIRRHIAPSIVATRKALVQEVFPLLTARASEPPQPPITPRKAIRRRRTK